MRHELKSQPVCVARERSIDVAHDISDVHRQSSFPHCLCNWESHDTIMLAPLEVPGNSGRKQPYAPTLEGNTMQRELALLVIVVTYIGVAVGPTRTCG